MWKRLLAVKGNVTVAISQSKSDSKGGFNNFVLKNRKVEEYYDKNSKMFFLKTLSFKLLILVQNALSISSGLFVPIRI